MRLIMKLHQVISLSLLIWVLFCKFVIILGICYWCFCKSFAFGPIKFKLKKTSKTNCCRDQLFHAPWHTKRQETFKLYYYYYYYYYFMDLKISLVLALSILFDIVPRTLILVYESYF